MRASKRARRERLYPDDTILVIQKLFRNFDIAIVIFVIPTCKVEGDGKIDVFSIVAFAHVIHVLVASLEI